MNNIRNLRPAGLSLLVAAAMGLAACGDKSADTPAAAPAAPPAPAAAPSAPPAPEPAPQIDASEKLNLYIECFNATHERAHMAMARYASWVKDMKAGPTGKESIVYGTYTVSESSLKDCGAPILSAAQSSPAMPALDAAAKAYSETLTAWGHALQEADTYYSRENYKDDAMAQGKAMHGDLVRHYEAFDAASGQYSQAIEDANDQRQLALLAEIEKNEGRKFSYWHMSTMLSAKQLVNLLEHDDFDVAMATERLKAYEDNADALIALTKQDDADTPRMWSLDSPLEDFRTAAKQRLRRVRDKTPYSNGERALLAGASSGWMVDGSPAKLVQNYNRLVESSNRMR
ncbi:YiiG family protein [Comamonas composti]|uniref:YiiG family protein n=1 Tax=Comamonas composti TaxID=408558 RepID=UPI0003FC55BF|nr:YiiG family protein [Comamonas composti]